MKHTIISHLAHLLYCILSLKKYIYAFWWITILRPLRDSFHNTLFSSHCCLESLWFWRFWKIFSSTLGEREREKKNANKNTRERKNICGRKSEEGNIQRWKENAGPKKKGASGVYMYAFLTGKLPWGESTWISPLLLPSSSHHSLSFIFVFLLPFDTPPPFRTQPRYTTPDPSPPIVAHTQREGRWEGWLHKNKFSTKLVSLTFLLVATGGSFFLLLYLFSILCFFFFSISFLHVFSLRSLLWVCFSPGYLNKKNQQLKGCDIVESTLVNVLFLLSNQFSSFLFRLTPQVHRQRLEKKNKRESFARFFLVVCRHNKRPVFFRLTL